MPSSGISQGSTASAIRCCDDIARAGDERELPLIDAEVGALLRVLATAVGATRILEIGTAIGYSGIWLAGALPPDGMLLTMEMDPERAREARENFARAGLADRVNVIVGDAQRMLAKVVGTVRPDLPGRRQTAVRAACSIGWSRCCGPAACSSPTTCCGTARSCPASRATPQHDADDTRAIAAYNERLDVASGS